MRFTIGRTSVWDDEVQPCPEAFRADVQTYSYYTFRTVAEAKKRYPDLEFTKTPTGVRTDRGTTPEWVVDVDSIDDLMALYAAHGRIVIEPNWHNYEQPHIDIYDTYRE